MSKVSRALNHIFKAADLVKEDSNASIYSKTVDRYKDEVIPGVNELASALSKILGCDVEIKVNGNPIPKKRGSKSSETSHPYKSPSKSKTSESDDSSVNIGKFKRMVDIETKKQSKRKKRADKVAASNISSDIAEMMITMRSMQSMVIESNKRIEALESKLSSSSSGKKIDVKSACTPLSNSEDADQVIIKTNDNKISVDDKSYRKHNSETIGKFKHASFDDYKKEKIGHATNRKIMKRSPHDFGLDRVNYSKSDSFEIYRCLSALAKEAKAEAKSEGIHDEKVNLYSAISYWFNQRYEEHPSLKDNGEMHHKVAYVPGWIINMFLKYESIEDERGRSAFIKRLNLWSRGVNSDTRYGIPRELQNSVIEADGVLSKKAVEMAFYDWLDFVELFNDIAKEYETGVYLYSDQFAYHLVSFDKTIDDKTIKRYVNECKAFNK